MEYTIESLFHVNILMLGNAVQQSDFNGDMLFHYVSG